HVRADVSGGQLLLRRPRTDSAAYATLAEVSLPAQLSTTGTWFHVGITHKIHETEGFYSVYINGVRVLNYEGDTRPSRNGASPNYVDSVSRIYATGGFTQNSGWRDVYVDDLYVDSYE